MQEGDDSLPLYLAEAILLIVAPCEVTLHERRKYYILEKQSLDAWISAKHNCAWQNSKRQKPAAPGYNAPEN